MTLAFVVPGLDEAASEKAIAILQNRLSQEQEAALVLKHAHWNVTGPNFIAVHEMLDPEVEAVLAQADETAERIATLGGTPDGRADAITRNRTAPTSSRTTCRSLRSSSGSCVRIWRDAIDRGRQQAACMAGECPLPCTPAWSDAKDAHQ